MKRFLPIGATLLIVLGVAYAVYSRFSAPVEANYRMARGRAYLETENYVEALKTLRALPPAQRERPETRSFIGAAYLRLHLYRAAIDEFDEAAKQEKRRPDPWLGLASAYIELGDAQKAVDNARRATAIAPKSVDAWILLGRALWAQKSFADAEKAGLRAEELQSGIPITDELLLHVYFDSGEPDKFQQVLARVEKPSRDIQDLAVRFFVQRGDWNKAYETRIRFQRASIEKSIVENELALRREPNRLDLYPDQVKNLVLIGRYKDALDAATKYHGPASIDLEVGKAYWMLNRKDEAVQAFERASKALIHKVSAEAALAAITGDVQHWREAYKGERPEPDYFVLAMVGGALKGSPVFLGYAYRYAGIFDVSFYQNAAQQALKVLDGDPKNLDALLTIATAYHHLGQITDAIRYMEFANETYPKNAEILARLASLAIAQKDLNKSVSLMEKAVQLDPGNASDLYDLGWMYEQLGKTQQAVALYERAIKASPLSFEAMNNLGLILEQSGQSPRALEMLKQAIRTDPDTEIGYYNLADYYIRQKDWSNALTNYDRVLSINPAGAVAEVEKGRIQMELGDSEPAIETLNQALDIDPQSFDAYMLLSGAYEKTNDVREAIAAAEEAERIQPQSADVKEALRRLNASGGATK